MGALKMDFFRKTIYQAIALSILALATYSIGLKNDFVCEDHFFIVNNMPLQNLSNITDIFASDDAFGLTAKANPYYRPITTLSFAVDYQLWGNNPLGFHLTNILIHVFVTVLLFLCMKRLWGAGASLLAAALFTVHPVNAEPVAYIVARADLLCGLFLLAAFLGLLHSEEENSGGRALYLSYLFFALALLSKIVALLFPPVAAAYLFIRRDKKFWKMLTPYLAISLCFILVRSYILEVEAWVSPPLETRLATSGFLLMNYLKNALLPFWVKTWYELPVLQNFSDPRAVLSWAALLLIVFFALRLMRHQPKTILGFLWLSVGLLPVSGIITFLKPTLIADRYLYIPLMGFAFVLAAALNAGGLFQKTRPMKAYLFCAAFTVVAALSIFTASRTTVWANNDSYSAQVYEENPGLRSANFRYAISLMIDGQAEKAFSLINKYPRSTWSSEETSILNAAFAVVADASGDWKTAQLAILEAIEIDPKNPLYLYYLSYILGSKGDIYNSLVAAEMAYNMDRQNRLYHENYQKVLKNWEMMKM